MSEKKDSGLHLAINSQQSKKANGEQLAFGKATSGQPGAAAETGKLNTPPKDTK
jgi:hypothetical protein